MTMLQFVQKPSLEFWVPGGAQTAGSKTSGVSFRKNSETGLSEPVKTADGRFVTFTRESGSETVRERKASWRADLAKAARRSIADQGAGPWFSDEPLEVMFLFVRSRPSSHYGTGRNAGVIKDWALSLRPVTRPDLLKHARAAEDALSGVVYGDDSQIVEERIVKAYSDQVGLSRRVTGTWVMIREWCNTECNRLPQLGGPRLTNGSAL